MRNKIDLGTFERMGGVVPPCPSKIVMAAFIAMGILMITASLIRAESIYRAQDMAGQEQLHNNSVRG